MVRFSEIQQLPYLQELFPGNFRTICPRFENLEIFGRMVSAHFNTDTEKKVLHSLRSALIQGNQSLLHLISLQTGLSGGIPFARRFILRPSSDAVLHMSRIECK